VRNIKFKVKVKVKGKGKGEVKEYIRTGHKGPESE
jgi:hypothetical protein